MKERMFEFESSEEAERKRQAKLAKKLGGLTKAISSGIDKYTRSDSADETVELDLSPKDAGMLRKYRDQVDAALDGWNIYEETRETGPQWDRYSETTYYLERE